jgi:hypothetical protein
MNGVLSRPRPSPDRRSAPPGLRVEPGLGTPADQLDPDLTQKVGQNPSTAPFTGSGTSKPSSRSQSTTGSASLLERAQRSDRSQGRQAPPPRPHQRTRACRLRRCRPLPRRRPRRPGRAPALPAQTPRTLAVNEPARALARGGPPAHEGDGTLPRRDQLPHARLGGARPVLQPRQQRRHPSPRSTASTSTESSTSRPIQRRRGGNRRLDSPREPKPAANLQRQRDATSDAASARRRTKAGRG